MLLCDKLVAACASRSNRAINSSSLTYSMRSTLSATSRFNMVSVAKETLAHPPPPIIFFRCYRSFNRCPFNMNDHPISQSIHAAKVRGKYYPRLPVCYPFQSIHHRLLLNLHQRSNIGQFHHRLLYPLTHPNIAVISLLPTM